MLYSLRPYKEEKGWRMQGEELEMYKPDGKWEDIEEV